VKPANLAWLVALAALWGGSFLFMRIAAPLFGGAQMTGIRLAIAAMTLTIIVRTWRKPLFKAADWRFYVFVGAFNSALPFLLFAWAAQTLGASFLSILNSMTPICGALVSTVWLRTRVTPSLILGLLLGVAGVAVVVAGEGAHYPDARDIALPVAACLFATLCYAVSGTYVRVTAATIEPMSGANGCLWFATLCLLPVVWLVPPLAEPTPVAWAALIVLGAICTGAAYIVYFRLLQEEGPVRTLSVAFLVPVFGVLWGVLFLDETFRWSMLAGALLVLFGTALTNGLIRLPSAGTDTAG
jgi:drug/metabolite transporter (DMT)-like permease